MFIPHTECETHKWARGGHTDERGMCLIEHVWSLRNEAVHSLVSWSYLMRQRGNRRGGPSLSLPFGNTHPHLQFFLFSLSSRVSISGYIAQCDTRPWWKALWLNGVRHSQNISGHVEWAHNCGQKAGYKLFDKHLWRNIFPIAPLSFVCPKLCSEGSLSEVENLGKLYVFRMDWLCRHILDILIYCGVRG